MFLGELTATRRGDPPISGPPPGATVLRPVAPGYGADDGDENRAVSTTPLLECRAWIPG